jgi:tetratricopeptide (TPR) repeat protein
MITRSNVARLALVAGLGMSLAGCDQYAMLKAKKSFKEANGLYQIQEYDRAAEAYEETLADAAALEAAPELKVAYFYLGNSYDNLYRPSRQGEPENDVLLDYAVENYELAAEQIDEPQLKRLSMEYLVAAYGPDKKNDPGQAEPIVRQMIELDPEEATNYFALAKLYEDSGQYDAAEEILTDARNIRPDDPAVYLQLAGYYNRNGEFEQTIEALQERANVEPDNPEAYYTIATYYWEKAFRDFRLTDDEKGQYVLDGLEAVDKSLDLKDDYMEAMVYKNILLRMQANATTDQTEQDVLIAEADELRERAEELRLARAAGVTE